MVLPTNNPPMLLLILLLRWIPPNFCQFALASSSYISNPYGSPKTLSPSLARGLNVRDTRSRTLYTTYDLKSYPSPSSSRFESSAIESEIAAIFKEFAYGSSTSPASQPESKATSDRYVYSTESSTEQQYFQRIINEPQVFIGKQINVQTKTEEKSDTITDDMFLQEPNSLSNFTVSPSSSRMSIHTTKSAISTTKMHTPRPLVEHPPALLELDKNNMKNDVQVTSVLQKKGYQAIQMEIGRAWNFHIYLTGILFGIVAIVCLFSLSRINMCSQLLPRGYYITLHLMVFLASFLRCLLFLHDPYGAYGRLPTVLTSLLFNSVDPCLTTAYSIMFLVILRAARIRLIPLNMQSPLVLAIICGIHIGGSVVIDVSSGVLEDNRVIENLNITTQATTASWGSILCLGYVISFSGIEKAAHKLSGDLVRLTFSRKSFGGTGLNKNSQKPTLIYAARLFLICTLLHGLLIAFVILNLVTTKVPASASSSKAWAWWTQTSLERIVEIALCVLFLATALVLTQSKPRNPPKQTEDKLFSILPSYNQGTKDIKGLEIYPVVNEKCNILRDENLLSSSLNGSLRFGTNGWTPMNDSSHNQPFLRNQMGLTSLESEYKRMSQQDCSNEIPILFSPQTVCNTTTQTLKSQINDPNVYYGSLINETYPKEQVHCYSHLKNQNIALSRNRFYSSQRSHPQTTHEPSLPKPNTIRSCHSYPRPSLCPQSHFNICKSSHNEKQNAVLSLPRNSNLPDNTYEISPYYTSSKNASNHVYTKPYLSCYSLKNGTHDAYFPLVVRQTASRTGRCQLEPPKDEMTACVTTPQSENHVDCFTDTSSSSKGHSDDDSLSRSLTLPIQTICHFTRGNDELHKPNHISDSGIRLTYTPPERHIPNTTS